MSYSVVYCFLVHYIYNLLNK